MPPESSSQRRAHQHQPDGTAAFRRETVRKQQADPDAEQSASGDDEAQRREIQLEVLHGLPPDVGSDRHEAVRPRVDDEEIVAGEVAVIVGRHRRKPDEQRPRNGHEPLLQSRRQRAALVQLGAKAGRERFAFRQARREVSRVRDSWMTRTCPSRSTTTSRTTVEWPALAVSALCPFSAFCTLAGFPWPRPCANAVAGVSATAHAIANAGKSLVLLISHLRGSGRLSFGSNDRATRCGWIRWHSGACAHPFSAALVIAAVAAGSAAGQNPIGKYPRGRPQGRPLHARRRCDARPRRRHARRDDRVGLGRRARARGRAAAGRRQRDLLPVLSARAVPRLGEQSGHARRQDAAHGHATSSPTTGPRDVDAPVVIARRRRAREPRRSTGKALVVRYVAAPQRQRRGPISRARCGVALRTWLRGIQRTVAAPEPGGDRRDRAGRGRRSVGPRGDHVPSRHVRRSIPTARRSRACRRAAMPLLYVRESALGGAARGRRAARRVDLHRQLHLSVGQRHRESAGSRPEAARTSTCSSARTRITTASAIPSTATRSGTAPTTTRRRRSRCWRSAARWRRAPGRRSALFIWHGVGRARPDGLALVREASDRAAQVDRRRASTAT